MSRLFSPKYDSYKARDEGKINYKKKIFIAYEGLNTEPEYFDKINKYLNSQRTFTVELFSVDRSRSDGKSHPRHVRDGMIEYYEVIKGDFIKNKDQLCIIVDTDKHFGETEEVVKTKYNEFLSSLLTSDGTKINAYVSNPCFELWLILQFNDGSSLNLIKLKENKKEGNTTYSKKELKRLEEANENMPIHIRVNNSRINSVSGIFENNISVLYNNVGTNLNELFDHIFGAIKK